MKVVIGSQTVDYKLSAQFAGVAPTCKDNLVSGWPFVAPELGKLTRNRYKHRKAYGRDAQKWHESQLNSLRNTRARSVAAREFHEVHASNFPVKNLAAAARNFSPRWLESYRARIKRMHFLRIEAEGYVRAAYSYRVAFAPHPSFFLPQPSDWSGCVSAL